ncbi:MAG: hypothetical protein [Caudoviricetes sp.]|nr:MAG: hypothetical protein [Caudoviricetes sp.]
MSYEINLSEELYGWTINQPHPSHRHVTPYIVITTHADNLGIEYYDRDAAIGLYISRIRGIFDRIGVRLSADACTAYVPDQPHYAAAYALITRAILIDIDAIIRAYEDDGWVVTPTGSVIGPDEWEAFADDMTPETDDAPNLYAQVTSDPGGTRQQITDLYAAAYRTTYGKTWGPYSEEQS